MEEIKVKIFGSVYALKSESVSKDNIILLSQELDELMQKQASTMHNINPLQVCILTALNLLEENQWLKSQVASNLH